MVGKIPLPNRLIRHSGLWRLVNNRPVEVGETLHFIHLLNEQKEVCFLSGGNPRLKNYQEEKRNTSLSTARTLGSISKNTGSIETEEYRTKLLKAAYARDGIRIQHRHKDQAPLYKKRICYLNSILNPLRTVWTLNRNLPGWWKAWR